VRDACLAILRSHHSCEPYHYHYQYVGFVTGASAVNCRGKAGGLHVIASDVKSSTDGPSRDDLEDGLMRLPAIALR
jgi:hypothetical protein